jgi:hypothetical protein
VIARGRAIGLATIAVAALALATPWPVAGVEAVFAAGTYPAWQRAATSFTNLLPFAVFDPILAAASAVLVGLVIRSWRRCTGSVWRRAGSAALTGLAVTAAVYLWFLLSWGFNYQRVPVATRMGLDKSRATPERVAAFADETVRELNRLRPLAEARPWPDRAALLETLAPAFRAALPAVGIRDDVVPGAPKWSILQPYFRWAGIDGVTDPFLPEIVVNHDLLPMEWPFTVAHEWGHLAGLAHEAEASYAGWLTCEAASDQARYSARLWALGHVFPAVPRDHQIRLLSQLDVGPKGDLRAIATRTSQSVQAVRAVSWATYDRYLKTNRVSEGLSSYDAAIVLILAGSPESRHRIP